MANAGRSSADGSSADGSIARVARRTLRTCVRGMILAGTAIAGLPLFPVSLACLLLLPAGLGVVLAPKCLLTVRRQASLQRRWALEWSGVTIAAPYRPLSAKRDQPAVPGVPALQVGPRRSGDLAGPALDAGRRAGQRGARAAARIPARRLQLDRGGRLRDLVRRMVERCAHGFVLQVFS